MHRLLRATALVMIVIGVSVAELAAQGADPIIGTWELNVAKSKYTPGPAPKSPLLQAVVEHEAKVDVAREAQDVYVVPGSLAVARLYALFGVSVEGFEATTVGGLISEIAGRIPQQKESVEAEGLRFEVLNSTDRRVDKVRVRKATAVEKPHHEPSTELSRRAK